MKEIRKVFLLLLVLIPTNLFAPNLIKGCLECQAFQHMYRQSKLRVQETRKAEMEEYLNAIGYSESGNNPSAYNKYGYIGKYQFGYTTRKACGFGHIKFNEFVRNPSIWSEEEQDVAMITLLSKNEDILKDVIRRYNGKVINNTMITKSGILAAAHLAGAGNVRSYFKYGKNPKDAFGTSLEDYLIEFSGFNF
jgi:hypothetical protein